MTIRTRLALRFTFIVGFILVIFSFIIYYFSSAYRQQEFYSRLLEKANNAARLLIEVKEVDHDLLKIIDKNTASLPEERVIIYNYLNEEIYNSMDDTLPKASKELMDKIRLEKQVKYKEGETEALGILYTGKYDRFVVLAMANDKYGLSKLSNLKLILALGLLVCVIATAFAGWVYSGQALKPISGVVTQVDEITALNLGQRVNEGNGADEIAQLAVTFNRMLDRIEKAFELQKSFVSNASHELRTPLTAVSGQLEVALMSNREPGEYKAVIASVFDDIKRLSGLTNGLIELAQANMDISRLKLASVRIDELLWQIRNEQIKIHPDKKIDIKIVNFPEEENKLILFGSEQLLKSALTNIMDNACKFSFEKQVYILFENSNDQITLTFIDKGIGIPNSELNRIFQPFYRGSNAKSYTGHGIGLSLTQKIIEMHGGTISIESRVNEYTKVEVAFPMA